MSIARDAQVDSVRRAPLDVVVFRPGRDVVFCPGRDSLESMTRNVECASTTSFISECKYRARRETPCCFVLVQIRLESLYCCRGRGDYFVPGNFYQADRVE